MRGEHRSFAAAVKATLASAAAEINRGTYRMNPTRKMSYLLTFVCVLYGTTGCIPPTPLGHEQRSATHNVPQVGATPIICEDFHARTDLSKVYSKTDVWYVKVAFYAQHNDARSDEELLRLSVSRVRNELLREIRQKHGRLGGRVPEYVQFVIYRENSPGALWTGLYTTATISPLSDLFDKSISPEDFLKRAIVRTPKESIPGEWYVDMAIDHYKNGQAAEDESPKSEEAPDSGANSEDSLGFGVDSSN